MEWLGVLFFPIVILLGAAVLNSTASNNLPWLSHGNDPENDCPDCKGTGIINEGDEHFECECPCTTRIYY